MVTSNFDYFAPTTLDEATSLLSKYRGEAKVLAVRAYDPDDPQVAPRLAKWRHLLTS